MRAAFYREQGPAKAVFQVGEQPTPEPAAGEVLVKLRTSGVNPSDWKIRQGGFGRKLTAPVIIPHSDGAGDICAVGPGVAPSRVGERVWIWNGQWKRAFGTAAEYIALPGKQAVRLPDGVDYAVGACLGIPALTAVQAVRLAEIDADSIVLVTGGAGSVGNYATQFAKARGARVIATVSSEVKAEHACAAGADEIVNYRAGNVGERIMELTGGRGVDAVIETNLSANAAFYPSILRPFAAVAVYGTASNESTVPARWLMQNSITMRFFLIYEISESDREAGISEVTDLLRQGKLVHTIARRFPLKDIAEAHDLVERGTEIGKVILDID